MSVEKYGSYGGTFTLGGTQYGSSFIPATTSSSKEDGQQASSEEASEVAYTSHHQYSYDETGMVSYPAYDPNSVSRDELGYTSYPASAEDASYANNAYNQAVADYASSKLYEKSGYGVGSSGGVGSRSRDRHYDNKGWRNPSSSPDVKSFYCETCKVSCAGAMSYKAHCEGMRHIKKQEMLKKPSTALPAVTIMCEVCDIPCSGPEAYNAHIIGSKHQRVVKLHTQLGKPVPNLTPLPVPKTSIATPTPAGAIKVSGTPRMNFKDGGSLTNKRPNEEEEEGDSSGKKSKNDKDGEIVDESNAVTTPDGYSVPRKTWDESVEPVGEKCIETHSGESEVPSFYCNVCNCPIGDPASVQQHIRGKKHKHFYMKKMDPEMAAGNPDAASLENEAVLEAEASLEERRPTSGEEEGMEGTENSVDESNGNHSAEDTAGNNDPIGEDQVIEVESTGEDGRPSFHCKICNCPIGDPASVAQHVRGKRHKYNYKMKIDPEFPAENPGPVPAPVKRLPPPPGSRPPYPYPGYGRGGGPLVRSPFYSPPNNEWFEGYSSGWDAGYAAGLRYAHSYHARFHGPPPPPPTRHPFPPPPGYDGYRGYGPPRHPVLAPPRFNMPP